MPAENIVKEVEVYEINIRCGRIKDDGKSPSSSDLRDGYFSRKHTLEFVLNLLVDSFQNQNTGNEKDIKKQRLWIGEDSVISEIDYSRTLEALNIKNGDKFYVEF